MLRSRKQRQRILLLPRATHRTAITTRPNRLDHAQSQGDPRQGVHRALNTHLTKPAAAHAASAIEAAPHGPVQGRSVQAQLQEILTLLASRLPDQGAALIGNASLAGSPRGVIHNTVRGQLTQLLSHLNEHIRSDDHDARYWLRGQPVDDANRLQGLDAATFARADHQHDDRYPAPRLLPTRPPQRG